MGGKSSGGNEEIVDLEREQAKEARDKETERQAKIDAGLKAIQEAFTGKAEYTTKKGAGTTVTGAGQALPSGYSWVQAPSTTTTSGGTGITTGSLQGGSSNPNAINYTGGTSYSNDGYSGGASRGTGGGSAYRTSGSGGSGGTAGTTSTPGRWYVKDAAGNTYEVGSTLPGADEQVFTGRTVGGIGEDFFKEYQTGVEDYLLPQVAKQYADAQEKETYDFARAGTSKSSAAVQEAADLAQQNVENEADVRKTADVATGDLRDRVEAEKAKAIAQVYATEDPTIAENQALTAVKNITNETPDISALGKVFETALIGGANALTGYKNQQSVNATNQAIKDAAKVYTG